MTFVEARVALQLEAEERIGAAMRANARADRVREDAAANAVAQAVEGA